MACAYFGLDCQVYMVKCSYEQKPFRREVMRTYGAAVTPSPSMATEIGRKILADHPDTSGSLGCAISEAVEMAVKQDGYRYVLGSVLNQVLLHQTIIGLETKAALDKYGIQADMIIGCAGGGSNLGGLISPFMGEKLRGERDYQIIAVEPASCPASPEENLLMITVTPVWLHLSRKCIPSAVVSFLLPAIPADCGITA